MWGICRLVRIEDHESEGTFGVLTLNGEIFCVTLEPPDRGNQRNISSIPSGQYTCEWFQSIKYGKTWRVRNVPLRDYILIHPGNIVEHTEGCILLGEKHGLLKGDRAALNSGNTFKRFLEVTKTYNNLHLTVVDAY